MPITTPNFTVTQSIGVLSQLLFTDTSVGSDAGLTERRITVTLSDGTTLVVSGTTTAYEVWPIAYVSILLSLLSKSQAATVRVDWMTGAVATYTKTALYVFDLYDYVFAYGLTQIQTSHPTIVDDTSYYANKIKLIVNTNDAENAVVFASDLYSAQGSLDRNAYFIANQSLFF